MAEIFEVGGTFFLGGSSTLVVEMGDSKEMVGDSNTQSNPITPVNVKKEIKFVRRGPNDKQPIEVLDKVYALSTLGATIAFNAKMAYGDGIMVIKKKKDASGKLILEEQLESELPDIFKFLTDNNYINSVQEWSMDIITLFESFCELVFARGENKIVDINPVESTNSRLSISDEKTGQIEWHGYSTKWHEGNPDDVKATPLLNRRSPIRDLKVRRGLALNMRGVYNKPKENSYMLQLMQPTPGRYYHGKPWWWAIFEAGWYDFAVAIPEFKKALLKNQMTLKYKVDISVGFWPKYYKSKGVVESDPAAVKKAKTEFLTQLDKFLAGSENAGKSFVSEYEYDRQKGYEIKDIIITPIESFFKGGEYLEDSEEVTNIICYALETQPSLIGASGKKGSINGTEARELFIIKQSMMKPIRDLLVLPLYIAKEINGWDKDIHFVIPNIMLTTLDKNTGAEKQIGNQKI